MQYAIPTRKSISVLKVIVTVFSTDRLWGPDHRL